MDRKQIPGFMAQGGDPPGTGMGGSELPDLPQEFNSEPHVRGVCSMARAQNPNSANSQFFICFDDARFLDNQYTAWGEVIEGMENVDALPKGEPPREPARAVAAEDQMGMAVDQARRDPAALAIHALGSGKLGGKFLLRAGEGDAAVSDGSAVTAADVAATLERARTSER